MTVPQAGPTRVPDRALAESLRSARAGLRDPGADLVPVEGGEPLPAEEPAPPPRPTEF